MALANGIKIVGEEPYAENLHVRFCEGQADSNHSHYDILTQYKMEREGCRALSTRLDAVKYIFHPVRTVTALDNYMLFVEFCEGVSKIYDIKPLFERIPIFNELKGNDLFYQVHVDVGGYGVVWNDKIDLAAEELYYNGTVVPSRFDGIMALGDAAEFWNIDDSTLRHAIRNGKFKCGRDITKFGKQWVITIEAMAREYGEPKQ